jgi:hypothetical protein
MLNHIEKTEVPLFISIRQLRKRKKKAFEQKGIISVDSGGFSELSMFGKWKTTPEEYIQELGRLQRIGLKINWASQQDWMVEPFMLDKTGLTIEQHQKLTVDNLIKLRSFNSKIHFIPVLQGQTLQDYFKHFEMFEEAGFQLRKEPLVGVGSVCRRQKTDEIGHIFRSLKAKGLSIHGFGVKKQGLEKYGNCLSSADSMAWSFNARYSQKSKNCKSKSKNCANCLHYALEWREKVIMNE